MTPFEVWLIDKNINIATISDVERKRLGRVFVEEMKAKRATTDKIVNK